MGLWTPIREDLPIMVELLIKDYRQAGILDNFEVSGNQHGVWNSVGQTSPGRLVGSTPLHPLLEEYGRLGLQGDSSPIGHEVLQIKNVQVIG